MVSLRTLAAIVAASLLCSCQSPTKCGRVTKMWQSGRFNDEYYATIVTADGSREVISMSGYNWAMVQVGGDACGSKVEPYELDRNN